MPSGKPQRVKKSQETDLNLRRSAVYHCVLMKTDTKLPRAAFSHSEFAAIFNRTRSWSYRMARSGRIRTITGYGHELVPSTEVDRILGITATTDQQAP